MLISAHAILFQGSPRLVAALTKTICFFGYFDFDLMNHKGKYIQCWLVSMLDYYEGIRGWCLYYNPFELIRIVSIDSLLVCGLCPFSQFSLWSSNSRILFVPIFRADVAKIVRYVSMRCCSFVFLLHWIMFSSFPRKQFSWSDFWRSIFLNSLIHFSNLQFSDVTKIFLSWILPTLFQLRLFFILQQFLSVYLFLYQAFWYPHLMPRSTGPPAISKTFVPMNMKFCIVL